MFSKRPLRPRFVALVLALFGLAMLAAACSNDASTDDAEAQPPGDDAVAAATATPSAPSTEVAEPAETPTETPTQPPTSEPTAEVEPSAPTAAPEATAESAPTAEPDGGVAVPEGVITDLVADAQGGRAFFDGTVNELADLEDLVADAWGDGGLGLHRGHAQVENVLEAFLGIDHDAMHDSMDDGLNLAATAEAVGQSADALVETLTYSYMPFVQQGVDNGVISADEAGDWIDRLRTEFRDRVYWDGVSTS